MARALVLGVNGQDGSYVAESLVQRGYEVTGLGRDPASRCLPLSERFCYRQCDLRDAEALSRIVGEVRPASAFHMAAVHGASGFVYEPLWRDMMAVNVLALHVLLEHARRADRAMRIVYAGSAKVFPAAYRAAHGVASTNLVLFNHESPRRGPEYLVPLIARTIARAKANPGYRESVNTLDFRVDWSSAAEFVLASGTTWYGREAIERLFARHGLESARHVIETQPRAEPGPEFRVSLAHLQREIGRRPVRTLAEIVDEMVYTQEAHSLA
jgi:GDPmannose 4,6-dehydratase